MSTTKIKFDEVASRVVEATKSNQKNFFHTWWGWISKDILHVTSGSGARCREIWHFPLNKNSGRNMFFKNTTGVADCWTQPSAIQEPDQFKRVMKLCNLPISLLHKHEIGEVVTVYGQLANLDCNVRGKVSVNFYSNSGVKPEYGKMEKTPGGYYYEILWEKTVHGEEGWVIVAGEKTDSSARISNYVQEIHVWGNPSSEDFSDKLVKLVFDAGMTIEYLETKEKGEEVLLKVLQKKIRSGTMPWSISVDGKEYIFSIDAFNVEHPFIFECKEVKNPWMKLLLKQPNKEDLLPLVQRDCLKRMRQGAMPFNGLGSDPSGFFYDAAEGCFYERIGDEKIFPIDLKNARYGRFPHCLLSSEDYKRRLEEIIPQIEEVFNGEPREICCHAWKGEIKQAGIKIKWGMDTHFFTHVNVEGEGKFVFYDKGFGKLSVFKIS